MILEKEQLPKHDRFKFQQLFSYELQYRKNLYSDGYIPKMVSFRIGSVTELIDFKLQCSASYFMLHTVIVL